MASFGEPHARLLIVGLAPGLKGANRTGRAFTGDASGELLHRTLIDCGFASGTYRGDAGDGVVLHDCMITNAVRCVPPGNKPTPAEIERCRPYLTATISGMGRLRAILALGRIAHDSTLRSLGRPLAAHPFAHGARHMLGPALGPGLALYDSFHCSRYNTNTGRLTPAMLAAVIERIRSDIAT